MKRAIIALIVLVAAPTAFAAPPSAAAQACKEQRATMGMNAFRLLYAPAGKPKAAMAACLAQQSQVVSQEAQDAVAACRTERGTTADSIAAFNEKYGVGAKNKNAFKKCVAATTQTEVGEQQQAILNAAKQCKTERGTTPATIAAFNTNYGTNPNKRNAFGKCVSKLASAQS